MATDVTDYLEGYFKNDYPEYTPAFTHVAGDDFTVFRLNVPEGGLRVSKLTSFATDLVTDAGCLDPIPLGFVNSPDVYLTRLEFSVSNGAAGTGVAIPAIPESLSGANMFLAFGWPNLEWEILPGMVLEAPQINISVARFPKDTDYQLTLLAGLMLGEVPTTVAVSLPDMVIRGFLSLGVTIPLKPGLDFFHLDGLGFDEMAIDGLILALDVESRALSFQMSIADAWEISNFSLEMLRFSVTYVGGPLSFIMGEASAQVVIDIAGTTPPSAETTTAQTVPAPASAGANKARTSVTVSVSASHAGPDTGWQFDGSASDITISELVAYINKKFDVDLYLPPAIQTVNVKHVNISFNTRTKDFTFSCEVDFPIGDQTLDGFFDINLLHNPNGSFAQVFGGRLLIAGLEFDLTFDKDSKDTSATTFVAVYENNAGNSISLGEVVKAISGSDFKELDGLEFSVRAALFAFSSEPGGKTSNWLFAPEIGADVNLSNLPLVGKLFPNDETLRIVFEPIVASASLDSTPLAPITALLPDGAPPLPAAISGPPGSKDYVTNLFTTLRVGDQSVEFVYPDAKTPAVDNIKQVAADNTQYTLNSLPPLPPSPPPSPPPQWKDLQQSFGPLHLEQVGLSINAGDVVVLLTGSLQVAGLTLTLEGLGATYSLVSHQLDFSLDGLGLDYSQGPIEIAGAFLRIDDDYAGLAMLSTDSFCLSAMGAYSNQNGNVSLFVYAFLDYPIGGPVFFFVEGLAAGFGYNRNLVVPPVDQIRYFPLVQAALGEGQPAAAGSGADIVQSVTGELDKLHQYISPKVGEYFLAVGLRFNSFQLIDCFALLTVSFGSRLEIDVIGIATLQVPAQESYPIAVVQMAFRAQFDPAEGSLVAQAELTSESYIFTPQCRLFGGYAAGAWFLGSNAGDFVYTLGGYHPAFQAPSYYPTVPRLGFLWQIDDQTTLKGSAYYALTPNAMMAGGSLEATWQGQDVSAWFNMGADFLMVWKPFYYEASAYVEIGADVTIHFFGTHHISLSAGADLELWGPEFAGVAHVHLKVLGIKFNFSVSFGGGSNATPPPLTWQAFKTSFLPSDDKVCSLKVERGMVSTGSDGGGAVSVVNPKELCITISTVIPLTSVKAGSDDVALGSTPKFGIKPMGLDGVTSSLAVTISSDKISNPEDYFTLVPITKQVPAALWGVGQGAADLNDPQTVEAVVGVAVHPKAAPKPDSSSYVQRGELSYDISPFKVTVTSKPLSYTTDGGNFAQAITATRDDTWLKSLGFDPVADVRLSESLATAFTFQPQMASIA